ncbi:hypothetical protein SAMN05660976_04117 [Nonomuraea pusilla]|uniref:[acyl-carrier-protein] S-malonyltransferase n=1 Tax=Nonomuraea pusilla TaxID=46177 RepID=A0A1H7VEL0_9ACTN|nr:hypothetical protein SAMN05660976_04117 [Nonomuraea pusilla]
MTPHAHPRADAPSGMIGRVGGQEVPRERLERRLTELHDGPLHAALPAPGTSEHRQLTRWVTQVILTEALCEQTAADLGLTPLEGGPLAPVAAVELGSINAAAYNGNPWVRAVYVHVTVGVTVPEEWRTPPPESQDGRSERGASDEPPGETRPGSDQPPEERRPATHERRGEGQPIRNKSPQKGQPAADEPPRERPGERRSAVDGLPGETRSASGRLLVRHRLYADRASAGLATPEDLDSLGMVTLDSLPRAVAEAIRRHPHGTLVGPVADALGWHVATATPSPAPPPPSQPHHRRQPLLEAARRRAFTRWLDDMRARKVELVPGLEHPGDPRQPDNHHKH